MSANHRGNGHRNGADGKVRVAIVGVGNCASSLVQGVNYYKDASPKDSVPGLMHVELGPYHIRDIEFVAAFDIDKNKVGLDLSEAVFTRPNNTVKFSDVPHLGVKVQRGMTHDGIGKYLSEVVQKAPGETSCCATRRPPIHPRRRTSRPWSSHRGPCIYQGRGPGRRRVS